MCGTVGKLGLDRVLVGDVTHMQQPEVDLRRHRLRKTVRHPVGIGDGRIQFGQAHLAPAEVAGAPVERNRQCAVVDLPIVILGQFLQIISKLRRHGPVSLSKSGLVGPRKTKQFQQGPIPLQHHQILATRSAPNPHKHHRHGRLGERGNRGDRNRGSRHVSLCQV